VKRRRERHLQIDRVDNARQHNPRSPFCISQIQNSVSTVLRCTARRSCEWPDAGVS
jgi:hypothetical protein